MKKVDVYFIIYIATIVSFFAIEEELHEYKARQKDILVRVAHDKIDDLVVLERNLNNAAENGEMRLDFLISGEFSPGTLTGQVFFIPDCTSLDSSYIYQFDLQPTVDEPNWYHIEEPISLFGTNKEMPYRVELVLAFEPEVSPGTMHMWSESFGDEKVANKIRDNISSIGKLSTTKKLPFAIIPNGGGRNAPFVMETASKNYPNIMGLAFEILLFIGGVGESEDFELTVLSGGALINEIDIGFPTTRIRGITRGNGVIRIRGVRLGDNESATVELRLEAIKPTWEAKANRSEQTVYISETYDFDGRMIGIDPNRISIEETGNIVPASKRKLNPQTGAFHTLGPFDKAGTVNLTAYVDGKRLDGMTTKINVVPPPPPSIDLQFRKDNTLSYQVVIFGKNNKIKRVRKMSGIANINERSSTRDGNKTTYVYAIVMAKPPEGSNIQNVKFSVKDAFDGYTIENKRFKYIEPK